MWLVTSVIYGRHDSYGATTSVIGIFSTEILAKTASNNFLTQYKKDNEDRIHRQAIEVVIKDVVVNSTNELILSKIYE